MTCCLQQISYLCCPSRPPSPLKAALRQDLSFPSPQVALRSDRCGSEHSLRMDLQQVVSAPPSSRVSPAAHEILFPHSWRSPSVSSHPFSLVLWLPSWVLEALATTVLGKSQDLRDRQGRSCGQGRWCSQQRWLEALSACWTGAKKEPILTSGSGPGKH